MVCAKKKVFFLIRTTLSEFIRLTDQLMIDDITHTHGEADIKREEPGLR